MKIDAEGAELKVLQGSIKLIRAHSPAIIIELLDNSAYLKVCGFLQDCGYGIPKALDGVSIEFSDTSEYLTFATNYLFCKGVQ